MLDDDTLWGQKLEVKFRDGKSIEVEVHSARGNEPELSNEETVEKRRGLMRGIIEDGWRDQIEKEILGFSELGDVTVLGKLFERQTANPIA